MQNYTFSAENFYEVIEIRLSRVFNNVASRCGGCKIKFTVNFCASLIIFGRWRCFRVTPPFCIYYNVFRWPRNSMKQSRFRANPCHSCFCERLAYWLAITIITGKRAIMNKVSILCRSFDVSEEKNYPFHRQIYDPSRATFLPITLKII